MRLDLVEQGEGAVLQWREITGIMRSCEEHLHLLQHHKSEEESNQVKWNLGCKRAQGRRHAHHEKRIDLDDGVTVGLHDACSTSGTDLAMLQGLYSRWAGEQVGR